MKQITLTCTYEKRSATNFPFRQKKKKTLQYTHEKCILFPYISILSLIHFIYIYRVVNRRVYWLMLHLHCQPTAAVVHIPHVFICIILSMHIWEMVPFYCTTPWKFIYHFTLYSKDKMHHQNLIIIPITCIVWGCHIETIEM